MDWLQKALDKSKLNDQQDFQFQTSANLKNAFNLDNNDLTVDFNNPARQTVPASPFDDRLLLTKQFDKSSIAAYNFLSAKTLQLMKGHNVTTLAVTSATTGSGTTLTAANLAISMSRALHETVVLVELDLHKPVFHQYFGLDDNQKGLSEYLFDNESLKNLIIQIQNTDLTLLTAGQALKQANLLGSKKIRHASLELKSIYQNQIIIYDLPALLDSEDALAFLPNIQSTILVVEEGVNSTAQVNQCIEILKNHELLGTVLNKAKYIA